MPVDPEVTMVSDTHPDGYTSVDSEVDTWAAREHQRRQAWLAGPSEREKAAMKAKLLARETRMADDQSFDAGKVDADVEFWVQREGARRKAWADGPDPLRDRPGSMPQRWRDSLEMGQDDMVRAWTHTDYAARGLWRRLYGEVAGLYNDLVEEGRSASATAPRRRRIVY